MGYVYRISLLALLWAVNVPAVYASHIVGGEIMYKFMDSSSAGIKYEITLVMYEDYVNGNPAAILSDNPATISIFNPTTNKLLRETQVFYTSSVDVPPNFSNSCISNYPVVGTTKKTFITNFVLPPSDTGYIITYQKCCRNDGIINIYNPGNEGSTISTVIPPNNVIARNTSAIFKNYPPLIICMDNPLAYDNSATDADGDSLSYEFCNALTEHDSPAPPPYDSVVWLAPVYNYNKPITGVPPIMLNPVTGLMTGTPNRVGRYLVTVCCHEWRNGMMINTTRREFQFIITGCSKVVVADMPQFSSQPNTYILDCDDYTVHFVNKSTGGNTYLWNFGSPNVQNTTSGDFEPTYTYPDTGIYVVKLYVNPGSTCQDSISKLVKVYPKFHVNFDDTGYYCPGLPVSFRDQSIVTIKPVTGWQWNFGDGAFSEDQNPQHIYRDGGVYNVVLMSQNVKGCSDTTLHRVVVEQFKPFAGNDTFIVKGESILFNAQGGMVYTWEPAICLSTTTISSPTGYYPDTGIYNYTVNVVSAYGCSGAATIQVHVVDHADFFVPNAFTPNGDGLNDVFRVRSVGYKNVKYFKIYNRFGEQVYLGDNIEDGWDGTCNHLQADIGTYFWQIIYLDRFGKEGYLKGDVTLIR